MARKSISLCENPIAAVFALLFCCSCLCSDYSVICYEADNAAKYRLNVDSYAVRNQRRHMEDRYYIDAKIDGTNVSVFAVFDGHGGKYVSSKARSFLMPRIQSKIQEMVKFKATGVSSLTSNEIFAEHSAEYYVEKYGNDDDDDDELVGAFKQMLHDEIISFDEMMQLVPQNSFCGSTAVIAIITGHFLIVANVGDSRAIMGNTADIAIRITKDHKPEDAIEKKRIESVQNGRVTQRQFDVPRVNNILAMSRALGDTALKEGNFIIAKPDIFVIDFQKPRYHPKYLVIATDGIWDVLEDQEVINLINEYSESGDVARQITQNAIEWYSRDNIAILIISFDKVIEEEESSLADEHPKGEREEL